MCIRDRPIQSGIESQTDSQTVEKLAQVSKEKIIKEAYVFTKPLSPHWAAEIDQKTINFDMLRLPNVKGSLIVETAGGLMVPITRNFLQIDQIKQWNLPVILVCKRYYRNIPLFYLIYLQKITCYWNH